MSVKALLNVIKRNHWVLPAYSVMQDLIGKAISTEHARLASKIKQLILNRTASALNDLLTTGDDLYGISALKKDIKNFTCSEIKREIKKRDKNREIYQAAKKLLQKLKISKGNIAYYASLAEYYTPYKLRRMPKY